MISYRKVVRYFSPMLIMLDEESSEEEPEKFFNADREPGQKPPKGGGCLGLVGLLIISLAIIGLF